MFQKEVGKRGSKEVAKLADDPTLKDAATKASVVAERIKAKKVEKVKKVDEIGQVLIDAADYIEMHGWCQHHLINGKASCALGGIERVLSGVTPRKRNILREKARARLTRFVMRLRKNCYYNVPSWNDDFRTTEKNVLSGMRNAAKMK